MFVVVLAFSVPVAAQEHVRAVIPEPLAAQANRYGSPGVDGGDYLYVSAQGPRRPDGTLPANFREQVTQSLDNIQAVVKAA